jgi:hypothetical protein
LLGESRLAETALLRRKTLLREAGLLLRKTRLHPRLTRKTRLLHTLLRLGINLLRKHRQRIGKN